MNPFKNTLSVTSNSYPDLQFHNPNFWCPYQRQWALSSVNLFTPSIRLLSGRALTARQATFGRRILAQKIARFFKKTIDKPEQNTIMRVLDCIVLYYELSLMRTVGSRYFTHQTSMFAILLMNWRV